MLRTILILPLTLTLCAETVNYAYDAAGRLIRADYGSSTSISYTYDAGGNLLSRTVVSSAAAADFERRTKSHKQEKRPSDGKPVRHGSSVVSRSDPGSKP